MTIGEAMRAVSDEYDEEVKRARQDEAFGALMGACIGLEYEEMNTELPHYVSEIARASGVKTGTALPPYVYQMARMCFRMGMRTQRKLDRPDEPTTMFWRSDGKAV